MYVIGITGRISSGKSGVTYAFKREGFPIVLADYWAHKILEQDLQPEIKKLIPEAYDEKGAFNRSYVSTLLLSPPEHLRPLAEKRNQLLDKKIKEAVAEQEQYGVRTVVLEDAMLFESGRNKLCNIVVCTSGDEDVQDFHALSRNNMTWQKLKTIKSLQMPIEEKVNLADYVIYSADRINVRYQVVDLIKKLSVGNNDGLFFQNHR